MKLWKYSVFMAGVLLLLLSSCTQDADQVSTATARQAMESEATLAGIAVEAVQVKKESTGPEIRSSGIISGVQEAVVVAESQGTIESASFTLGQAVEKGEALLRLDDSIQRLSMEEAKTVLDSARIDLTVAERLSAAGDVSQAELIRARSAAKGAEARYESARKAFEDRTVTAPISGYIAAKDSSVSTGNYLQAGTRVARIVDTSRLRLEISVGEQELRYLSPGNPAFITVPVCGQDPFEGRITEIAAGSDPETASFPVVIEWENSCGELLRSGLSASVTMPAVTKDASILIPDTAILRGDDQQYVFTVQEGKALRRPVEVEERAGSLAVVRSGLAEGDTVILSGLSSLKENDEVIVTLVEDGEA